MKRSSRAFALAAVLTCLTAAASAQEDSRRDYLPVFDQLWSIVNDEFFDPQMNGIDWRAVRERYRPEAERVQSDEAFETLATRMLGELRVSHLRVAKRPQVPAVPPAQGWGVLPTVRDTLDGVYHVKALRPYGVESGFRLGDRIPVLPTPGPVGERTSVKVEGCDGLRRTVSYVRAPRPETYEWRVVNSPGGERIGWFRLDRFGGEEAIAAADQAMAALADTDGLIIDVRNNTGGDSSAIHLLNYFAEGSRPAMIVWSRGALAQLGRMPTPEEALNAHKVLGGARFSKVVMGMMGGGGSAAAWTEGRGEDRYRKPVVVLTGPRTGSSGEAFAWGMKLLTPARLIGRTTAGALLSEETFQLSGGWSVTLPNYGLWGADGRSYVDRPVTPHEQVATTRADLCAARDPELEAAFRYQDVTD